MLPFAPRVLGPVGGVIAAALVLSVTAVVPAAADPAATRATSAASAPASVQVPANRYGYRWSVNGWTGSLVLDGGEVYDSSTHWNFGYMRNDVDGLAAGTATPIMLTDRWIDQQGTDGRRIVMLRLGQNGAWLQRYDLTTPSIFPSDMDGTMTHWVRQPNGSYTQTSGALAAHFDLAPLPGAGLVFQNYAAVVPQVGNFNWFEFPYHKLNYHSLASGVGGGRFVKLQNYSPTAHSELAVDWDRFVRGQDRGFYDDRPVGLLGYLGGSLASLDAMTLVHVNDAYMSNISVWSLHRDPVTGYRDGVVTDWWMLPGGIGTTSAAARPGSMKPSMFYLCRLYSWGTYQYCFQNYFST